MSCSPSWISSTSFCSPRCWSPCWSPCLILPPGSQAPLLSPSASTAPHFQPQQPPSSYPAASHPVNRHPHPAVWAPGEHARACGRAEQLPTSPSSSGDLHQDSVPELLRTSATTSDSSSPAGAPWPPATPDTQSTQQLVTDLSRLQRIREGTGGPAQAAAVCQYLPADDSSSITLPTYAAEGPSLPPCSPAAPAAAEQLPAAASASWPAQSLVSGLVSTPSSSNSIASLSLPSRKRSKQALAARRNPLRAHGILDQVPRVTPVMMLSGLQPEQYLFIQEHRLCSAEQAGV